MVKIRCKDGPYDGHTFKYPDPLPNVIVIADDSLHYHEYHRDTTPSKRNHHPPRPSFRWERTYRIPEGTL